MLILGIIVFGMAAGLDRPVDPRPRIGQLGRSARRRPHRLFRRRVARRSFIAGDGVKPPSERHHRDDLVRRHRRARDLGCRARANPRTRWLADFPNPAPELRAAAVADIVLFDAVLRPTLDPGAHATGLARAKGTSSPRDAGQLLPFPAGAPRAWVPVPPPREERR